MDQHNPNDVLRRLLDAGRRRARANGPDHARLWDCLTAATEGGKRFRPTLVVGTHDALGGSNPGAAAQVGAAVELLHTALVVHDDVIDGDEVRRGQPNVNGSFRAAAAGAGINPVGAQMYGRTAGILAGDLALATAVRAVATCGAEPEVTDAVLDLFDTALHTTAAGELADVGLALGMGQATLATSLTMAQQKTSAYSFALPLQAGAVLAGAGAHTVTVLGEAGRLLGTAFQLLDDLLGVFGDPVRTGKSVTSDLATGKQTPLLTHAQQTPEWPSIRMYVGRELPNDELSEVQLLLQRCGSRGYVEQLIAGHVDQARRVLADVPACLDLLAVVDLSLPAHYRAVVAA